MELKYVATLTAYMTTERECWQGYFDYQFVCYHHCLLCVACYSRRMTSVILYDTQPSWELSGISYITDIIIYKFRVEKHECPHWDGGERFDYLIPDDAAIILALSFSDSENSDSENLYCFPYNKWIISQTGMIQNTKYTLRKNAGVKFNTTSPFTKTFVKCTTYG